MEIIGTLITPNHGHLSKPRLWWQNNNNKLAADFVAPKLKYS